jgi:hypothetical protein
MLRPIALCLAVAIALAAAACRESASDQTAATQSSATQSSRAAATQPTSFTGTLRGSAAAIGGETTGWRLEGDAQTGGIDVDVSKVQQRARSLDGKRVEITGKMTTRSWPERGQTQVLIADKIDEAPRKDGSGTR